MEGGLKKVSPSLVPRRPLADHLISRLLVSDTSWSVYSGLVVFKWRDLLFDLCDQTACLSRKARWVARSDDRETQSLRFQEQPDVIQRILNSITNQGVILEG
jgi:hypothetical protein